MLMSKNHKVAVVCASVAFGMIGLAYASVPLYRLFCQTTGFGGTTQRALRPSADVIERMVTVRFDANVGPGLSWDFVALEPTLTIRLGENAMATYRVTNKWVIRTGAGWFANAQQLNNYTILNLVPRILFITCG